MSKSKAKHSRYCEEEAAYIRAKLAKSHTSNIAVYLPDATDADIDFWRTSFSSVQRQPFGYIRFEITRKEDNNA